MIKMPSMTLSGSESLCSNIDWAYAVKLNDCSERREQPFSGRPGRTGPPPGPPMRHQNDAMSRLRMMLE